MRSPCKRSIAQIGVATTIYCGGRLWSLTISMARQALALCLICGSGLAGGEQEWAELFSRAETAWEIGHFAEADALYSRALHEAESFERTDIRRVRALTGLALSSLRMGK